MKTNLQRNLMYAFTGLFSLAVLGTANAQGTMKKPKSTKTKSDSMMKSDGKMMDSSASAEERRSAMLGAKFGDYKYVDPAPLNYPIAAPDTLNVYHYDTYKGNRISEGSAQDTRMEKAMMVDKMAMKEDKMMGHHLTRSAYYDNPFTADPAPVNYPLAAPGTLDVYTYTDYTQNHIKSANFFNTKMDKQMMKDTMTPGYTSFSRKAYYDDPFAADPAPVNYPLAAPGSLDLYHFSTYQGNEIGEGSASDKKMEKQMMKDKMTPGSMKMDKSTKKSDKMKK